MSTPKLKRRDSLPSYLVDEAPPNFREAGAGPSCATCQYAYTTVAWKREVTCTRFDHLSNEELTCDAHHTGQEDLS